MYRIEKERFGEGFIRWELQGSWLRRREVLFFKGDLHAEKRVLCLDWWRKMKQLFLSKAQLAQDALAVQAMCVASENRLLLTGGLRKEWWVERWLFHCLDMFTELGSVSWVRTDSLYTVNWDGMEKIYLKFTSRGTEVNWYEPYP